MNIYEYIFLSLVNKDSKNVIKTFKLNFSFIKHYINIFDIDSHPIIFNYRLKIVLKKFHNHVHRNLKFKMNLVLHLTLINDFLITCFIPNLLFR